MSWTDTVHIQITWTNPCALEVTGPASPVTSASPTVTWKASGRWDLDPEAKISIYLQPLGSSGSASGSLQTLASGLSYKAGSHKVQLSGLKPGASYRFELRKDGDAETGARGPIFVYSP